MMTSIILTSSSCLGKPFKTADYYCKLNIISHQFGNRITLLRMIHFIQGHLALLNNILKYIIKYINPILSYSYLC